MEQQEYNKKVNHALLSCWQAIALTLTIAYFIEVLKGLRTVNYFIVFSIFTILPLIITTILNKKQNGENLNIKYFAGFSYLCFYTFSMLTTQERVSFVYIIPMASILIVYCDLLLTNVFFLYSIILNVGIIIKYILNGYNSKSDITFYEIQIACLVLSYYFLRKALILIRENIQKMFYLSDDILVDELSGAYNRKFIKLRLIPKLQNNKNKTNIAFIDIDNFKQFNTNYGHDIGDIAINTMSSTILNYIKNKKNTYLIRNGGDEFVLISIDNDYDGFVELCETIREKISTNEIDYENQKIKINISIGTKNGCINNINDFDDLLQLADSQLYKAKNAGKNRVLKG